jgi:hemolysin III
MRARRGGLARGARAGGRRACGRARLRRRPVRDARRQRPYHRWDCSLRLRSVLRRIDHSALYVFVAASYTPVSLLVLHGTLRWVVLGTVWAGCLAGVTLSVAWITAPRVLFALTYVGLGWTMVIAFPRLVNEFAIAPLVLFAAGAACSTRPAP